MSNASYFVRITLAYERIQTIVSQWTLNCEHIICYEHIGNKTEKVHCHILIIGSRVSKKRLQQIAQQSIVTLKGNQAMSFKAVKEGQDARGTITYMSKGTLEPKYFNGFTVDEIRQYKGLWVEPTRKHSKYEILYNDFIEFYEPLARPVVNPNCTEDEVISEQFNFLLSKCKQFIFNNNNRIWSPKCVNDYKTIIYTYVMREGMRVPKNSIFKKELL